MSSRNFGSPDGPQGLSDQDLVAGFQKGEVEGREVMGRLLGKIGLSHRSQEVLVRKAGGDLTGEDGSPLRAEDYLSVAAEHPHAVPAILGFVTMDEHDPKFPAARGAILHVVNAYLPPEASTGPE